MSMNFDVTVIGGGPAGLAAALSARKAGAERVAVLERDTRLGGILNQCIHNGFGLHFFGQELTGPEYAARFVNDVKASDISVFTGSMALDIDPDRNITCVSPGFGLETIRSKAVVLAMGCRERTRGALNIAGTRPAGIYTAGCAQRLVNIEGYMPGKRVVVLGSGDIGLIMARRMAWEGAKVECVCEIMPFSSGLNRNIVQCLNDNDIPLYFNTTVVEIHGKERVSGVMIASVDENRKPLKGTERFIDCDTLLLSVGLIPENELTESAGIDMDPVTGGAVVDERRQTSVPGVFACGNVLHVHDLVDNVSLEAQTAGESAAAYALGSTPRGAGFRTIPGRNVRYIVPQIINGGTDGKTALYFRTGVSIKPAVIEVLSNGNVILSRTKQIVTPGEMERIDVDLSGVAGDITINARIQGED